MDPASARETAPRVGLFVTCLVDFYRPNVGFAAVKLLEEAGCEVVVPQAQACCGQPAYNSGDTATSRQIARQVIQVFEAFDYVVAPSGSCIGMLREHYPRIFPTDAQWRSRAERLASRCHELMTFLHDVCGVTEVSGHYAGTATYHDSCSGLRELSIHDQPRRLLDSVDGLTLTEMPDTDVCCGFGGTFCVKYPEISAKLVADKARNATLTGATTLLGGDLGCLLNIAGRLSREGSPIDVYHAAEVLAGLSDGVAPVGKGEGSER